MYPVFLILANLLLMSCVTDKVEDASKVQTLLFSATLPGWVQKVCFKNQTAAMIVEILKIPVRGFILLFIIF